MVPAGFFPTALRAAAGAPVKVAIRPESIRPSTKARVNAADFALGGLVNCGDSGMLVGAVGPTPLKIRLPARDAARFSPGDVFTVSLLAAQSVRSANSSLQALGNDGRFDPDTALRQ